MTEQHGHKQIICGLCGKTFKRRQRYTDHVINAHNSQKINLVDKL